MLSSRIKKNKLLKNIITCLFLEEIQIYIYLCALSELKKNVKQGSITVSWMKIMICLLPIEPQIYIHIVSEFC